MTKYSRKNQFAYCWTLDWATSLKFIDFSFSGLDFRSRLRNSPSRRSRRSRLLHRPVLRAGRRRGVVASHALKYTLVPGSPLESR